MKKILIPVLFSILSTIAFANSNPNDKVRASFDRTFIGATDVRWSTLEDDYFEASFSQNSMNCRVTYDTDGNVLQSTRYYSGSALPLLIQSRLAKKFKDKKIFGVTEMTIGDQTIYHVVMNCDKEFVNVQSDSYGNINVQNRFKRACSTK